MAPNRIGFETISNYEQRFIAAMVGLILETQQLKLVFG